MEQRWIEPLDVLYLRGNQLFGGAGDHADALMPPWPSLIAGALRSRMLADSGVTDFSAFKEGQARLADLDTVLGTPARPGSFRVHRFSIARRIGDSRIEPILPLPSDLVVHDDRDGPVIHALEPVRPGLQTSASLPMVPILQVSRPAKPLTDFWLTAAGIARWQAGLNPLQGDLIRQRDIWLTDSRLGIALDRASGSTVEGMLYTTDTVAFRPDFGFYVAVGGADGQVPADGLLRLGGDGRAARVSRIGAEWPEPDYAAIAATGRMRIVLTAPGIFPSGSSLPGLDEKGHWFGPCGVSGRLCAAAAGRPSVVSGWDLAERKPKPAMKALPTGSVFWLDTLKADGEALRKLANEPLPLPAGHDQRAPEGFNQIGIAAWPEKPV